MNEVSNVFTVIALILGLISLALSFAGKRDLSLALGFLGLYESYLGLIVRVM